MGNSQNIPESPKKRTIKYKKPSDLMVNTLTWNRDSHGLFDYECKNLAKKSFKAQSTGYIRRSVNDIGFTKDNSAKEGNQDLLKLSIKEGSYWISSCKEQEPKNNDKDKTIIKESGNLENDPWIVVKSFKANTNKGFQLNEGDLIKLGRVKFRIRELRDSASNQNNNPDIHDKVVNTEVDNNMSGEESFRKSPRVPKGSLSTLNQTCRICLSETCETEDPFICPCACSGTMKFIHIKCLQTWLRNKTHTKVTGNTTFVFWKTLECELCKTAYPQTYDHEGKRFDIVEFERPNSAYIALEVISKDKNVTRGVHIVKLEGKNNIRLGRGHDADIRITDISVSRCHALIKLEKGQFFLEDNNSKFGTLCHMNRPIPIQGDFNNLSVQVGRSLICISSKKSTGMSCLGFGGKKAADKKAGMDNNIFSELARNDLNNIFENYSINNNAISNNNSPANIVHEGDNQNRSDLSDEHNNSDVIVPEPVQVLEPQVIANPQNIQLEIQPQQQAAVPEEEEGNIGSEANERSFRNYIVV